MRLKGRYLMQFKDMIQQMLTIPIEYNDGNGYIMPTDLSSRLNEILDLSINKIVKLITDLEDRIVSPLSNNDYVKTFVSIYSELRQFYINAKFINQAFYSLEYKNKSVTETNEIFERLKKFDSEIYKHLTAVTEKLNKENSSSINNIDNIELMIKETLSNISKATENVKLNKLSNPSEFHFLKDFEDLNKNVNNIVAKIKECGDVSTTAIHDTPSKEILQYFLQIKYEFLKYCFSVQETFQIFQNNFELKQYLDTDPNIEHAKFLPSYINFANNPLFNNLIESFSDNHLPSHFLKIDWTVPSQPYPLHNPYASEYLPQQQAWSEEINSYHLNPSPNNLSNNCTSEVEQLRHCWNNGGYSRITNNNPSHDQAVSSIWPFAGGFVVGGLIGFSIWCYNKLSNKVSNDETPELEWDYSAINKDGTQELAFNKDDVNKTKIKEVSGHNSKKYTFKSIL